MVTECLSRYDRTSENLYRSSNDVPPSADVHEYDAEDDDYSVDEDKMAELLQESQIPLFEGSSSNRLVATLHLLKCFTIFGVPIAFADELLKLMSELLPERNTLPKTYYEGRKYLSKLGMTYNSIHACGNGCCLFRKELQEATKCPKCNESRYTSDSSKCPVKVLRHFPLIPRLKRMFRCTLLAQLMKWHARRTKNGDKVECVPDSKAWQHIDATYLEFRREERNLRLGMALDGVNLFRTSP
jgi:hypothetical protein